MSEHFPEPKSLGGRVKAELYLSHYSTRADLENRTGFNTTNFAKKVGLAHLKSDVHKLHTDKMKNVQSNLKNLESKVEKLDGDKLVPAPVDLS